MAQGEVPAYQGREPNPPTWNGSDPGLELPVFEKNVKLWEFESELDSKKRGVRLLRCLTGSARSVADTLTFEQVASEKGVENIMEALRSHFQPHMEVSLPRAFERAVYGAPRSSKESLQEYIIRSERSFNLLEKEGLKLDATATGYILYRQASLNEAQDLKFTTWSKSSYDWKTVVACLRKLDKVVPEHRSKQVYMQDDQDVYAAEMVDDGAPAEEWQDDDDEQYIFIEAEDADKVYDEEEVQIALATYQEVRKAISSYQKGRRFFRGKGSGKRGPGGQDFFKGKKRIHIEELKLRTRCARCGATGHWAKECRNEPDQKGRRALSLASSASDVGQKSSSSATASSAQKSWYVASGVSPDFGVDQEFSFSGFVGNELGMSSEETFDQQIVWGSEDEMQGSEMKGLGLFEPPDRWQSPSCSLFCGLTTCPTMAVVDTAAQDGLVGDRALLRLEEKLADHGLKVKWTGKQAKAHGVGGQAVVKGIIAIPLGLAGTSGVMEATVVEGDIPLLLPVKLLRQLHSGH